MDREAKHGGGRMKGEQQCQLKVTRVYFRLVISFFCCAVSHNIMLFPVSHKECGRLMLRLMENLYVTMLGINK